MRYVIHYDVAALVLIIIILMNFLLNKTITTRQTRAFSLLVWLSMISNAFDIITIFTIENPGMVPNALNYLLNEIYLITFNAITMVYYLYIVLATKEKRALTLGDKLRMTIPLFIDVCLILSTPWTKYIFYFDDQGNYMHGYLFIVLYVNAVLYLIFSMVHVALYKDKLSKGQKETVYFYSSSCIAAVLVQMMNPKLMLVHFVISVSIMLIYLSLENPEDYKDKRLGTYNRHALLEILLSQIGGGRSFDVLGIQIEGMKYINETMGAANGILLLKQISEFFSRLSGKCRLFYLPGFRFAIVSVEKGADLEKTAGIVQARFESPFIADNMGISLSVRECLLSYPENVEKPEDVEDMMEYLLTDAKEAGEKKLLYGNKEVLQKGRRENKILQILKEAVRKNLFEVYYQPIYSVKEQRFTSAEALIRLHYGEMGFISPEEFIPMAEKNGLILEIGEYVFEQVCRFMTEEKLKEKGIEFIDVNLSVVQCMQEKLYEKLLQIMDKYQVEYSSINFEITETAAVMSFETLWKNMQELMKKGVKFSLDDYGTGFSNTASVIRYPFHTIKMDKSMIWGAMENEKAMFALKHTVAMIKDMKMKLVAEGVENLEQAEILTKLGCDYFQGYYYSRPVCREEFLEKIKTL